MRMVILSCVFALAAVAIGGLFMQGCAKSGDADSSASGSDPEFTITGEAI